MNNITTKKEKKGTGSFIEPTKRKKRRKIKRNPNGTKANHYFTMATQEAIVKWQRENNQQLKDYIYVTEILPAFDALVENLINVYGFKVNYESKEDLKAECLEFLYTAVPKFKAEKGSKAFSYFNVVSRNWLTIKSKQNAKRTQQYVSLDGVLSLSDLEKIESHNIVPSYDEIVSKQEMKEFLGRVVVELESKARTPNEKLTVSAIKEVIDNLDDLDLLSKRAVLLYIREISNLTSKQLSIALSSLKKHYREFRKHDEFYK